ncbi:hypothetical protein [Helicobacter salomonis]|uniref:hypothetical protein n=1 Tax=Helicobacter salomonis TaxID=56878 RepID=UPI000CF0A090|nr:hypothetical protein [Helicobacter salomonis]
MEDQAKLAELDKNLASLKERGIQEIAQTTKIAHPKITAILEKRFEDLQRVHAVGFIQILEKEYDLNLGQWLIEYDKSFFFKPPIEDKPDTSEKSPFVNTPRSDPEALASFQPKKTSKLTWVLPLVLLVGVGAYIYYNRYTPSQEPNQKQDTSTPSPTQDNAESSVAEPTSTIPESAQKTPEPSVSQAPQAETPPPTTPASNQEEKQITQANQQVQEGSPSQEAAQEAPIDKSKVIVITPKEEVWMERIDLNTRKKTQVTIRDPLILETKGHKWLLAFGRGNVSLEANGQVSDFRQDKPLRLLYTPKNGLRRISYTHYQERSK